MLAAIPDAVQVDGSVSYNQGWGIDYTLPSSNPSYKYMPWGQFNQLFYDITSAIQVIQQGSPPAFITSAMNGGSPYSYPKGATVSKSGVNYVSLVGSNTTTPPSSSWGIAPLGNNLFWCGTSTGAANVQILTTGFGLTALSAGQEFSFIAGFTSTTATMTFTIDSVAATEAFENGPSGPIAVPAGGVVIGNQYTAKWNGTELIVNATANLSAYAPIASPTFTGIPAAPTASYGTNTSQLATTAFTQAALIFTPLAVRSVITAVCTSTQSVSATVSASTLTPCYSDESGDFTGDTITGTWAAQQTYGSTAFCISWQRTI